MERLRVRSGFLSLESKGGVFRGTRYTRLKRGLDIGLALGILLLVGTIMAIIAIAVKATSRGSIFYRQKRIGKDGKPFEMLKFRSMRQGNDCTTHREHVQRLMRENVRPEDLGTKTLKVQADSRVTPLGKFIRATSLDELPQLFNVLRGEMSIVGPRPPLPYEYELYKSWHKARLDVLPGITGVWQVKGRNQVSFDEMVAMDLAYIKAMNPWLDLKIMLLTPVEMLIGVGAG